MRFPDQKIGLAKKLRASATGAERRLWPCLRMGRLGGFKFRRQSPIGPYIADFHCPECRLVVEIDGATHPFKGKYELQRQQYFIYAGFVALHFSNHEIFNHLESVCSQIKEACLEAREKQARNTTSEPAEPA